MYLLYISRDYDFDALPVWIICTSYELNPHAASDAELCYDYLNNGECQREMAVGMCRYRHLPPDHIDAIVDQMVCGRVCFIDLTYQ